jgi:hypothetical protein
METIQNRNEFDKRQSQVLREIIHAIRKELKAVAVPEERLADVTGKIAFSVAAIIDSSRVMKVDGQMIFPFLAFAEDKTRAKLIAEPGGSWMHEYVFGMVDDIFDEVDAD